MKKITACLLVLLMTLVFLLPPKPSAAQGDMPIFFRDTLVGAGIGAFFGGLIMLTTEKESDHWDYVAFGALVGATGGLVYSVRSSSYAALEIDNEKMTVGMPTFQTSNEFGVGHKVVSADLVRLRY